MKQYCLLAPPGNHHFAATVSRSNTSLPGNLSQLVWAVVSVIRVLGA